MAYRVCLDKCGALYYTFMEKAFRRRGCHKGENLGPATGLAEDSDIVWIAAELGYVVADPLKRSFQVYNSQVSRMLVFIAICAQVQEAQYAQPVGYI